MTIQDYHRTSRWYAHLNTSILGQELPTDYQHDTEIRYGALMIVNPPVLRYFPIWA